MNQPHYDIEDISLGLRIIGTPDDADLAIQPYVRLVKVMPDLGDITLTLAHAVKAPGHMLKVMVADVDTVAVGATTNITLTGGGLASNLDLDADGDHVILWSDGEMWNIMKNGIA